MKGTLNEKNLKKTAFFCSFFHPRRSLALFSLSPCCMIFPSFEIWRNPVRIFLHSLLIINNRMTARGTQSQGSETHCYSSYHGGTRDRRSHAHETISRFSPPECRMSDQNSPWIPIFSWIDFLPQLRCNIHYRGAVEEAAHLFITTLLWAIFFSFFSFYPTISD